MWVQSHIKYIEQDKEKRDLNGKLGHYLSVLAFGLDLFST